MAQRITPQEWKIAARKRYLDLRDDLQADVQNMGEKIDADHIYLREMNIILRLAKLHGLTVKE